MRRCRKLLNRSPAETNSMTVRPISTVSMVLRSRAREALALADREDSCSAVSSPLPVEETAGRRPASSPVMTTSPAAKAKTHASTCTESARGRLRQLAASQCVEASDSNRPRPPPAAQISRLSVICSRIKTQPAAAEGAANGNLFAPRCSPRHQQIRDIEEAINSMQPTAHSSTSSWVRTPFDQVVDHRPGPDVFGDRFGSIGEVDLVLHRAHLVGRRFRADIRPEARYHLALVAVVDGVVTL